MKSKSQDVGFKGIGKDGVLFYTPSLEICIELSTTNPMPVNRKSRRAMPKLIKKIMKG